MMAEDLRSLRLGDFNDWHRNNDSAFELASSSDKLDGDLEGIFKS